ncbi:hypothetical protein K7432_000612 [Basidiobolus ranarum]|uniref:Uncharacterized protein n=1 Tax=Basidiobolus ranarum TaxID=34480 RepID=A0ABR2X4B8_9FUNG
MQYKSFLFFTVIASALAGVHGQYGMADGGYGDGLTTSSAIPGYGENTEQVESNGYGNQCKLAKKISLLSDNDKYLGRCEGCVPYSTNLNNAFVHGVGNPKELNYLQWDVVELGNGKIALRADSGLYLGRCSKCYKMESHYDSASIHVMEKDLRSSPWAHWELGCVGGNKITLKGDTGNYLSRCNGCVTGGAYPDSAFVHNSSPNESSAIWKWTDLSTY